MSTNQGALATVGLVLVSHSEKLAEGLVEVAAQMAPDVKLIAAGGTNDHRVGTSVSRVSAAVRQLREAGIDVLLLTDIGSASMVAETVAEEHDTGVSHVEAPFVEGAVAAAVAAQSGAKLHAVSRAAVVAAEQFGVIPAAGVGADSGAGADTGAGADPDSTATPAENVRVKLLTLRNRLGLHARPAAMVARIAAEYDAKILLNGTDASSVLALMGLALPGGAEVELRVSGPQANAALAALVPHFEEGFGEE